ncbi:MAG: pimeloyl-CoA dehydrogenase small subunit [Gammaproteobacteria bacterium]|nr:MAG: pimeloyl-CoA dehydrogenase small subunit [Gammaproteobacteria bacterium]
MDFSLSEEQQLLKDSITQFVDKDYQFDIRQRNVSSDLGYSSEFWKTFADLGWLGMPFSEEDGGYNGGPTDLMVIMESLGRGLVVEPYIPNVVLAGGLISRLGSSEQKSNLLPKIISGENQMSVAFSEPQSRFNLSDVITSAKKDGDNYILDGYKSVVMNGPSSNFIIIVARTSGKQLEEKGLTLFLLDPSLEGVSLRNYSNVDGSKASEVTLESVTVSSSTMLGKEGEAYNSLEEVIDLATLAISAEAIGIMEKMNEITLEYTKTREQFGETLSSFQALQHRMVDTFMAYEQTKSLLLMCAAKLTDKTEDASKSVSALKYQVGIAAKHVGEEAVQLHGGMGVTDETNIGHYFKRLTTIRAIFGNTDYHLKRYSDL